MAITFNPATDTVNHIEFAGTAGQTVTIVDGEEAGFEFEIKRLNEFGVLVPGTVTYSHPYGYTFADMVITIAEDGKSFTYASQFQYAVRRTTYYLIQDEPTAAAKQYFNVESPHLLPANFKGIYRVDPPEDLITITWTITGRERVVTPGSPGDPTATPPVPPSAPTYGPWYDAVHTWTQDVQSSIAYTATAIRNAVKQGEGYKHAITVYPEATLP